MEFLKYEACGNDFVLVPGIDSSWIGQVSFWQRVCDRHRGVGADGVLFPLPGTTPGSHRMIYLNSDGQRASMCGNGLRSLGHYLFQKGERRESLTLETDAGPYILHWKGSRLSVQVNPPRDLGRYQASWFKDFGRVLYLDTGVPHVVIELKEGLHQVDMKTLGHRFRFSPEFPQGANVNFFQELSPGRVQVRTYERGVESETLSCGTGIQAVVESLLFWNHDLREKIQKSGLELETQGGVFLFELGGEANSQGLLSAPVRQVFQGQLNIDVFSR